ncbi:unnamed protein product [Colletotrichum noveboracense]|uniref:Uncharacterized protein n=2 Tax=Colletotrichum gloeosporioides species complex TaxID=2707338 RepID=T0KP32_COLGC|nr:hypothetical protein CGLO_06453 [Colletotrichum gloeosporioides Cg-14]CAI0652825.1 unnamed protein product [Colletotrichum noveboracense]
MQLSLILLSAASVAFALPQPANTNTYCTGKKVSELNNTPPPAQFKNQWNCPAGSSSPPATYIQMTQNGAAEGGVTVFCTI